MTKRESGSTSDHDESASLPPGPPSDERARTRRKPELRERAAREGRRWPTIEKSRVERDNCATHAKDRR